MRHLFLLLGCSLLLLFGTSCGSDLPEDVALAYAELPDDVDYNYHIKPILSDRCFSCHGPDAEARQANLRLDIEDQAKARLQQGSGFAIVPGKTGKSQVVHRILSQDPELMMPPPESNLNLTPEETAYLVKWIEQGAEYKPHWSFIQPEKPEIPQVENGRIANPIDNFILEKLAPNELSQAPKAGKERLLRRVSMDLTGLPPTLAEIDAFLADDSPEAFEKVVDRLLESDAYAERLALDWMDIARYADSHGLHADGWRNAWPWRDWVIEAFRQNMSYKDFVTKQLAGDLLPNATKDDILATAFCRNHPMTAEGGAVDEEFRLEYVADRTNTAATAFLGLTMECARCHDHKYDPISQKEYYQMSAFFNNQKELGMTGDDGNYGPVLLLTSDKTDAKISALTKAIHQLKKEASLSQNELATTVDFIEKLPQPNVQKGRAGYYPFERMSEPLPNKKNRMLLDGKANCFTFGTPKIVPGKVGNALEFDDGFDEVHLDKIGDYEVEDAFSGALWLNTSKRKADKTQMLMGNTGNKNSFWRGWEFYLDDANRLSLRLISILPHNYLHVRTLDSLRVNEWTHVAFTYDGSGGAAGVRLFVNGEMAEAEVPYDRLFKSIRTVDGFGQDLQKRSVQVGKSRRGFTGENGIFKGKLDEIYIFNRTLSHLEVAHLAQATDNLDKQQLVAEHLFFQKEYPQLQQKWQQQIAEKINILDTVSEVMVMEEMSEPRPTHVLFRGNYDQKREEVQPATPTSVLPFPEDLPQDRLGFARWLFHEDNPLTARVAVNHYWQMIFGKGLVKTSQDFGSQGSLPSHPELLDWLAVSFQEHDWDVKWLLKTLVLSETYQQSSDFDKEKYAADPDNIWLSRSPTYRYPGELIRDNALAASGLLVKEVGGESVKPYQPDSLWIEKGTFSHKLLTYQQSEGEDLYRRSLYTFIKRTSPPPAMAIFDQPTRSVCQVKRETTNTPLQSLVLLNDPQFVEAAKVMAERMQQEGETLEEQIVLAFRLTTGRKPVDKEVEILKNGFEEARQRFEKEPVAADELLAVGEYELDRSLDKSKTAALTMLASTILNHDEAYMRR